VVWGVEDGGGRSFRKHLASARIADLEIWGEEFSRFSFSGNFIYKTVNENLKKRRGQFQSTERGRKVQKQIVGIIIKAMMAVIVANTDVPHLTTTRDFTPSYIFHTHRADL
jgi:hypothetical protein